MNSLVRFLVTVLLVVCYSAVQCQITVDNSVTPLDAMQTLLGENVTISNLNYEGQGTQIGTFDCLDCGLDFNSGIILSTGDVANAEGPNSGGGTGTDMFLGPVGNADLDLISPTIGDYHDVAVLEFDFVALGDSVWFDYIWASEEYHFYTVDTGPFDVFALLISGLDINGPFSDNAENIAIVPGTGEGVSNISINNGQNDEGPCVNCEYLVSNGEGQPGEPQTDDITVVEYDAYTTGLTASKGGLVCGETYHLKFLIADKVDGIFDSAIILRAGSLTSNLAVQVELEIEATNEDGVMNEECGLSTLIFRRPDAIDSDLPFTVNINYEGEAQNGIDYTTLPEIIIFQPGEDEITFLLDAFEDGITEGPETVILQLESVAVCEGTSIPTTFEFIITESVPPVLEGYEVDICAGGEVEIEPIIEGGSGGFVYDWSTDETTQSITVSPEESTSYNVSLSDTCLATTVITSIDVNVAQFPDLEVTATPEEFTIDCNWFAEDLNMSAIGGDGDYSYQWLDQDGNNLGFGSNLFLFDGSVEEIIAQVTDGCGVIGEATIIPEFTIEPFSVTIQNNYQVCPGPLTLEPEITGEAPFFISWFDQSDFSLIGEDETLELDVTEDMSINLNISDNCGGFFFENINIEVTPAQDLVIAPLEDEIGACLEEVTVIPEIISAVQPLIYTWTDEEGNVIGQDETFTMNVEENTIINLFVEDLCGQNTSDQAEIVLVMEPLVLDIPELLVGDCLTEFEITASSNYDMNVAYAWTPQDDLTILNETDVTYQSLNSTDLELTGDAGCGNTAEASTEIDIVLEPIVIENISDLSICEGAEVQLVAEASGGNGILSFDWSGGQASSTNHILDAVPLLSETFTMNVYDQCEQSESQDVFVEVYDVNSDFSFTQVEDQNYSFLAINQTDCPECLFDWQLSDGAYYDTSTFSHEFDYAPFSVISLTVTAPNGCQSTTLDSISVPIVYIPNSFSPNNDGLNDTWKPVISGITEYELTVFNRWGDIIFTTTDPQDYWQGNDKSGAHYVPNGVYNYLIEYRSTEPDKKVLQGTVSLFR